MEQWYDKEEDILGVRLQDKEYFKSIELQNGIIIDISKDGSIIGMEIPQASKIFLNNMKQLLEATKIN